MIALISADLFTSALATLLQTLGCWKVGARLPSESRAVPSYASRP